MFSALSLVCDFAAETLLHFLVSSMNLTISAVVDCKTQFQLENT
jgi:hypothetical protein